MQEFFGRDSKAVKISTSNGMGVKYLGITEFDNQSGLCQRDIQKRYFGISEEGEERFRFFRISSEKKDKERYQRMLEGYWKTQIDAQRNSEGACVIITDIDDLIKTPEFKALYNYDQLNYYLLISKISVNKDDFGIDRAYKLDFSDGVHRLA